jgi:hypothetical protein
MGKKLTGLEAFNEWLPYGWTASVWRPECRPHVYFINVENPKRNVAMSYAIDDSLRPSEYPTLETLKTWFNRELNSARLL